MLGRRRKNVANWENLDVVFPNQLIAPPDNQVLSVDQVKNSDLEVVTSILNYTARNMIYKQEEWAWGKNDEFAIASLYDVNSIAPHPDSVCPLNVYGMTMLYDYLSLNGIEIYDD